MAKRSRNNRAPRETSVSRYRQVRALVIPPMRWMAPITTITKQTTDDRRQWNPQRWGRPVVATKRDATPLVVTPSSRSVLPAGLSFKDPSKVLVCHRRKTRREVLLAQGKGGGGNKAPKRKPTSEVTC